MAAAIRWTAPARRLPATRRAEADDCADHLRHKRWYLDDPHALHDGWPIASRVIEGACRHLVKDRLDLTWARWGRAGAEAVLRLRALRTNGDVEEYWRVHVLREKRRRHESRDPGNSIPGGQEVT